LRDEYCSKWKNTLSLYSSVIPGRQIFSNKGELSASLEWFTLM
jgi:hypothetical protein